MFADWDWRHWLIESFVCLENIKREFFKFESLCQHLALIQTKTHPNYIFWNKLVMALVFPLNSSSRSQAAQESAPHRKTPAEFTSDYLHNIPQTQLQMRTIYNPQQHQQQQQTQLLQNQSSNVSRFVGAAPKLPKRGVNSFMAFRGKIHESIVFQY